MVTQKAISEHDEDRPLALNLSPINKGSLDYPRKKNKIINVGMKANMIHT